MDLDLSLPQILQPPLFQFGEASAGAMELFPAVWSACEELAAPDATARHKGLDRLLELGAPRLSPLVTYLLTTRLADPDTGLRARVVQALGALLLPDLEGRPAPEPVRRHLVAALTQMRTRSIYALLEVAYDGADTAACVARLLNVCPYAGGHLVEILNERKLPLTVRRAAVDFIGSVGYLEAIPALERLATRLEARLGGQQSMPFAPPVVQDETDLLPVVQAALAMLKAP
jgi:HEAT repeat protein